MARLLYRSDVTEVAEELADEAAEAAGDETTEPVSNDDVMFGAPVTRPAGQTVLHVGVDDYLTVISALKDDGFSMIIDVIGVDYLLHDRSDLPVGVQPERFEVVVLLLNSDRRERVRVRLQVGADTAVPSLFDLYPGSEAMEREAFDMFGIEFADHPDLSRILMPETWEGHPLRKDFDIGRIPVQFKGAPSQR